MLFDRSIYIYVLPPAKSPKEWKKATDRLWIGKQRQEGKLSYCQPFAWSCFDDESHMHNTMSVEYRVVSKKATNKCDARVGKWRPTIIRTLFMITIERP